MTLALMLMTLAGVEPPGLERSSAVQSWPLDLAVQVGSLGFYPQDASPSLTAGTEYALRRGQVYELAIAGALGWVYSRENMLGGLVELAAVNRWRAPAGLYAEVALGAGYQLTLFPGTTYVAQGGSFVAGGNAPESMFRARLSAGIGFDFSSLGWPALRVSASYSEVILTPYAPGNGIPAMPGAQLGVAVSVPLRSAP
jgi:hypothetical protein